MQNQQVLLSRRPTGISQVDHFEVVSTPMPIPGDGRVFRDRYPEGLARLAAWMWDGRIAHREDVLQGIGAAPGSGTGLHAGENMGKWVIQAGPA